LRVCLRLLSFVLLLAAALPSAAPAQGQSLIGRVRGVVVDARTGQPLARVRVALQPSRDNSDAADGADRASTTSAASAANPTNAVNTANAANAVEAVTAADGRFELEAPAGPATLTASAIGYALARQAVIVPAGGAREVSMALSEGTGVYTEEVRVFGDPYPTRDPGVATEQTLTSADLQSLKSLIADDPLRAVQALPGVAATDDVRSEFSIRGSDFGHIGVSLDGIPSPLLVHTVHGVSDAGSLAMINSDILDTVTVSAGSYPQRFGDRTGAFVDFRTRDGARDRVHARASVSAVNASGLLEGPLGDGARGSWLVAARQSYADWIVKRIDPDVTGTFGFTDAQGKLAYALSPRHTLHVNLVAGRSQFNERRTAYGANSLDVGANRAGIASVSLRSTPTPALTITQRVYGVAGRYRNRNPDDAEIGRGASRDLSYRVDATQALSPRLLIEAGGHLQWLRASGRETSFDIGGVPYERAFEASASRQSAYALARWEPHARLLISPGARVDHWSVTGQTQASPWLQTEWRLPRAWIASASGGLYRQAPELEEVFGPHGSLELRTAQAWQGDAGIGQRIGVWRWQLTAFVRREENQPRLPEIDPKMRGGFFVPPSYLTRYQNAIDVASHGVEIFLHRRAPNGLSGWIGYAYANTENYDVNLDERFPGDVDQRHTFNAYGRYRLSDRTSLSARFRYGSNTPVPGYYDEQGGRFFISDQRNQARLPAYTRLDLRADRTLSTGRRRLTLFGEVVNVYNRHNLRAVTPLFVGRGMSGLYEAVPPTARLFPIIPSIGLTVEF
jgi:hypothetical protein